MKTNIIMYLILRKSQKAFKDISKKENNTNKITECRQINTTERPRNV